MSLVRAASETLYLSAQSEGHLHTDLGHDFQVSMGLTLFLLTVDASCIEMCVM